jgi:alginate O-acetyltransferase complex protein AlgI
MTFTSWQFALFATIVLGAYYLPPVRNFQVQLLVAASLFFYGYSQPELLPLLGVAVGGTYLFLVLALRDRRWLPAGIVFNLALLAFFKYKFLFLDAAAPAITGIPAIDFLLKLPLPIGISFFVFHNISLMVDLTRDDKAPPPNLADVFLYIIFFPQLVAGPITRASMFMPQIQPKRFVDIAFVDATKWIVTGFFFKLYVANNLNEMTSYMDFPFYETLQTQDHWVLAFLYSCQIYADFFGYSGIAIGLALLFGYRLPINFDLPYLSASFAEFWTRWHISLSTWLRTYLYIPLGGNRLGKFRTYLNLIIVMGLGGLWHGAGLGYLVWGLMHGLLLAIERPFLKVFDSITSPGFRALRIGFVFVCVTLLWIFFKLPNFDHAFGYLDGMFKSGTNPNPHKLYYDLAFLYVLPVILQLAGAGSLLERRFNAWEPYLYGAMGALAYLEAGPATAFIYFQF